MNTTKKILIIGATSEIAQHVAYQLASNKAEFHLIGRNAEKLLTVTNSLSSQQVKVTSEVADLLSFESHHSLVERAFSVLGDIDVVLIAHGELDGDDTNLLDYSAIERSLKVNFLSVVSLLSPIVTRMREQRKGLIAVMSSIAGDRGKKRNFVYSTAKGTLTLYLQGLRNYLHRFGIHVLTIKPGLTATPMTQHMKKNFLMTDSAIVANRIAKAIIRKWDVVYAPAYWRFIMFAIQLIPERIFKRLNL